MNYLTLLEIADMIAENMDFENITAGCIDASLEQTIGVYQRADFVPRESIGTDSSYETDKVRLLIRWGNNPTEAEAKAADVGELI